MARFQVYHEGGWPEGRITVNAGFDSNEVKRTMGHSVWVPNRFQGVTLRFLSRPYDVLKDALVAKHYAVSTHFELIPVRPPHLHSVQEDIDALLAAFPQDLWGHAYAAQVLMRGEKGFER